MFLHLQKILRALNSDHGIDLANPHGATVEGRHYPAIHKHLYLGDAEDLQQGNYTTNFQIPLENGTRVLVDASNSGYVSSHLQVPTIHFDHEGVKSYHFGPAYHVGDDAYWEQHKTPEWHTATGNHPDLHETIREHSRLPQQGTFDWETQGGYKAFAEVRPNHTHWAFGVEGRDLNEEDLAEHKKNFKFNELHGPMHISTTTWLPNEQKNLRYRYNLRTEQMHLMNRDED
jgi:hypothetical protein